MKLRCCRKNIEQTTKKNAKPAKNKKHQKTTNKQQKTSDDVPMKLQCCPPKTSRKLRPISKKTRKQQPTNNKTNSGEVMRKLGRSPLQKKSDNKTTTPSPPKKINNICICLSLYIYVLCIYIYIYIYIWRNEKTPTAAKNNQQTRTKTSKETPTRLRCGHLQKKATKNTPKPEKKSNGSCRKN